MSHVNQDIAAKVQWLADIEEIKQLKARYAAACDDDYDPDAIAELFTEDAVWDGGMLGFVETREGIREFFARASDVIAFAVHSVSNPLIEIEGDRARGQWYLHQPLTLKNSEACFWLCAQYHDEYVRTAAGWRFQHVKVTVRAYSPYEEGFGKQLIAEPPRQED
jgi:hypothetical protein